MIENALTFLLNTLTALFLLRFFMQWRRISFANPVGDFVLRLTGRVVKPLRRVIPGFFGLDIASLVAAYLVQLGLTLALSALHGHLGRFQIDEYVKSEILLLLIPLILEPLRGCLRAALHLLIWTLILQAVLSWTQPHSPLGQTLARLTHPVLAPIRRFIPIIPIIANIDLSPMAAVILAQFLLFLI